MIPTVLYYSRGLQIDLLGALHDHGRLPATSHRFGGTIPYSGFIPSEPAPGLYPPSYGLHAPRAVPLFRITRDFMFAEDDRLDLIMKAAPGSILIRKEDMVGFDEARMKTFWKFESGGWVTDDNSTSHTRTIIKFDVDAARDEMVRFLTNMFGDWHFNLSAQERSLDHAKDHVKRRFAERLHKADPVKYPEVPAFRDLPNKVDAEALLSLRKLRDGKPADTLTLEELAWLTECGVRDAMKGASTEAELLAAVEKVTKGVLKAEGFNNVEDMGTFWTLRDGISPVWQHDIIDQGNEYLTAESRILAGLLNTESHHPAPLAVILAVAKSVEGFVHTRSVR